jgi:hypothetical protein
MGNTISNEHAEEMMDVISDIMRVECCELDIGDRVSPTEYIDFIPENVLDGHDIMKGIDTHGRFFIVVNAHIVHKNKVVSNSCTTFFQRYKEKNICWMACGKEDRVLMETGGGMSLAQLKCLRNLIYERSVKNIEDPSDLRIFANNLHNIDILLTLSEDK